MKAKKVSGLLFRSLMAMLLAACQAGQRNTGASHPEADPAAQAVASTVPAPTPEVVEFDPATARTAIPDDILAEVNFYGGGGGVYYCNIGESYDEPQISKDPSDEELMVTSSMIACGWEENEVLEGSIQYPDGKVVTRSVPVKEQAGTHYAILSMRPWIMDPAGVYTYRLKGKKGIVTSNAYFRKPQGPRLTAPDADHVFLSGFQPHETVRVFYYAIPTPRPWGEGKFSGWQEYQVDPLGQLTIRVQNLSWSNFVVIGAQSGELHGSQMDGSILKEPNLPLVSNPFADSDYLDCPSEMAGRSHLQTRTTISLPKNNILFANPRQDARIVERLPIGTEIFLADGPFCAGPLLWWTVSVRPKNEIGYLMQLDEKNDYLNP